ncbi:hypothetical protein N3K66_007844 [Trichothecium roseum]|uniref:Uncharacterized protein n=1 Tax=Trichothecium roseum TaxID=47278 RepID=A0ACC0UUB3_9HYPO|nr:hypothetical protein N3K66_007844 [Trichothecium roseum]
MSKQTPRKPRGHNRIPSNRIPATSDYESDVAAASAAGMAAAYDYAPPPPTRTNTDLNLSVLQRYLPSIHTILSIAANAVVYVLNTESAGWEKSGVEGTMFVCAQAPAPADPAQNPRACIFVLSRRSLENVVVDLARVSHVEVMGELIIVKVEGSGAGDGDGEKVLGLWVHNDRAETREVNAAMVQESWKIARESGSVTALSSEAGPALQAIGGQLTLNHLFTGQANAGH